MTQLLLDGICMALYGEFGDAYEIYTEPVEQGLEEPCFIVLPDLFQVSPGIGGQERHRMKISLSYYPVQEEHYADCCAVLKRLYDCLSVVAFGTDYIRGFDFFGQVDDEGVLQVELTYEKSVVQGKDTERMRTYTAQLQRNPNVVSE